MLGNFKIQPAQAQKDSYWQAVEALADCPSTPLIFQESSIHSKWWRFIEKTGVFTMWIRHCHPLFKISSNTCGLQDKHLCFVARHPSLQLFFSFFLGISPPGPPYTQYSVLQSCRILYNPPEESCDFPLPYSWICYLTWRIDSPPHLLICWDLSESSFLTSFWHQC